jgi:TetR/AcrR family transcriptional repressor of nem operon
MARPREFDRADALNKAMAVFWLKGYAATSTSDLLDAMQIGRQSMYDTFGDKHALYLEALRHYSESSVGELLRSLQAETALNGIANMLLTFASRPESDNAKGCMGVNAVCEFGQGDAEVNAVRDASSMVLNRAVERVLRDAVAAGEMRADTKIADAVAFVAATLSGMKVSAKAGATPATLRSIASFAIAALRHSACDAAST